MYQYTNVYHHVHALSSLFIAHEKKRPRQSEGEQSDDKNGIEYRRKRLRQSKGEQSDGKGLLPPYMSIYVRTSFVYTTVGQNPKIKLQTFAGQYKHKQAQSCTRERIITTCSEEKNHCHKDYFIPAFYCC